MSDPESEVKRRRAVIDEIIDDAMRQWRDDGDLARLAGKPLDLSDNSPEWFANRMLKNEGFSHPTIERGRDVEQLLREADDIAMRFKGEQRQPGSAQVSPLWLRHAQRQMDEYRQRLEQYNRAALAFNLSVPDSLHKELLPVDRLVAALKESMPSLQSEWAGSNRPGPLES